MLETRRWVEIELYKIPCNFSTFLTAKNNFKTKVLTLAFIKTAPLVSFNGTLNLKIFYISEMTLYKIKTTFDNYLKELSGVM